MDPYVPDIYEIVFRAIRRSGAAALVVPPQDQYPPEFLAVESDKTTRIRVVVLPLFQERPATDYRTIMMVEPGLIPGDLGPDDRIVVVGYEFEKDIFVGFDVEHLRKHLVPSGQVPIPWRLISSAEEHSIAFGVRVGDEFPHPLECRGSLKRSSVDQVLVAFTPEHFLHFAAAGPSWFSCTDVPTIETMYLAATAETMTEVEIHSLPEERAKMARTIYVWVRDSRFSRRVLKAYGNRCAITGLQLELPVAAHILPVASGVKNDKVSNGIALSPTFHAALDDGLIYLVYRENEDPFGEKKLFLMENSKTTGYLDFRKRIGEAEMVLVYTGKEIMPANMPKDRGDWPEEAMIDEGNRWRGVWKK